MAANSTVHIKLAISLGAHKLVYLGIFNDAHAMRTKEKETV